MADFQFPLNHDRDLSKLWSARDLSMINGVTLQRRKTIR